MKAILISIKPKYVADILNGKKTVEIRKKFPKGYVGWVYIYCTSHNNHRKSLYELETYKKKRKFDVDYYIPSDPGFILNSKVVARFWVDKVEYVENTYDEFRWGEEDYSTETFNPDVLYEKSCLSFEKIDKYLKGDCGYAIHITNLEIFDKPKELKEFYKVGCEEYFTKHVFVDHPNFRPIYERELKQFQFTRAPQSWCYVEI